MMQQHKKKAKDMEAKKLDAMLRDDRLERSLPILGKIAHSRIFEGVCTLVAIIQVMLVTIYTDCQTRNTLRDIQGLPHACAPGVSSATLLCFYLVIPFFIIEWGIRLYDERLKAFRRSVFLADTACTWIFGVGFGFLALAGASRWKWLISLNVLRILHVIQSIYYIARLPFVKEVWLLIRGFSSSLRTLICSALVLTITIYIFAVIGTGTIGHANKTIFQHPEALLRSEGFNSLFSSIFMLIRFLFLDNAYEIVDDLAKDLPGVYFYYYIFVCAQTFVIMNLIIGIIVDKALEITSHDQELIAGKILAERRKLMEELANIFQLLDTDGSGSVTFEEFIHAFQIKEMRYMLQALDFDEKDLIDLFQTLDDDNAGCLNLEEFLYGMSRLQGEPRPKDFLALMKLTEACADLSKYLSLKLTLDSDGTGKSLKVAGERTRDLANRINELRQKVIQTSKVLQAMIAACKTIKAVPIKSDNYKSTLNETSQDHSKTTVGSAISRSDKSAASSDGPKFWNFTGKLSSASTKDGKGRDTRNAKDAKDGKDGKDGKKARNIFDANIGELHSLLGKDRKGK